MRQITILGATGSVGQSTLDIIARHPDKYKVFALTANTNVDALTRLCEIFKPTFAVMVDAEATRKLSENIAHLSTRVLTGEQALNEVAAEPSVDTVVAAIVGSVGLMPTLAAVRAGKRVLLANKESLVMAGSLFMEEVHKHGARLLPVDSEHNAIFQCLPDGSVEQGVADKSVVKIILTGSGGPFRDLDLGQFENITPQQAIAHPNWEMGPKISVDSATMMNKGLELIEACWLFSVEESDIDIVLHRQSIVHSMVSYSDGSVIAQMGNPDMRTPIAHALAWPQRIESGVEPLSLVSVSQLDFAEAEDRRYPCLALARDAWRSGGTSMAILNAANETAVDHFLNAAIKFNEIAELVEQTLNFLEPTAVVDLEGILAADRAAREYTQNMIMAKV
ncbi:MAG: 1-deoxy-D-xylulose-5-phosphate reductoisomerase [Planctomycetota bacterium]|jgi:1-deoxy-D-xylulose-5-phosphate reductoisomerase